MKRQKYPVKREMPEASTSRYTELEEHDLAYYIQDRVELLHQVFSVLKHKDLRAMAPECVRRLPISDLQELCLEELLGISSKRLCATLDGAEPPSDTESSSASPEKMETISLDSISSDDEILSESSSKRHRKHKHHKRRDSKTKSKHKGKKCKEKQSEEQDGDQSKASRAGLTVLELLELQARARAIRAQLQNEQANKLTSETIAAESSHHSSDNEVEIKEEPAEVVEISSEDEKPKIKHLVPDKLQSANSEPIPSEGNAQSVTKRINNLVITVPQTKQSRKIKLNRNKTSLASNSNKEVPKAVETVKSVTHKSIESPRTISAQKANDTHVEKTTNSNKPKEKLKKKLKKKEKKHKNIDNEGSDHDEICLQLSDSEKMDLLENFDRKNYDNVSSSGSEDTDTSSSESDSDEESLTLKCNSKHNVTNDVEKDKEQNYRESPLNPELTKEQSKVKQISMLNSHGHDMDAESNSRAECQKEKPNPETEDTTNVNKRINENISVTSAETEQILVIENIDDIPVLNGEEPKMTQNINKDGNCMDQNDKVISDNSIAINNYENTTKLQEIVKDDIIEADKDAKESGATIDISGQKDSPQSKNVTLVAKEKDVHPVSGDNHVEKELSDGEVSDRESSEVEALDIQPYVVCISDEESGIKKDPKKKKKKEKKSKKEKKAKKSKSDFHECADQNFYKECNVNNNSANNKHISQVEESESLNAINLDDDDVYEILELSEDSSCYEVEGVSVSKEPTTAEIEALSAKIDEIEREEVVTDEQIREHEESRRDENSQSTEDIENISWKDRYLDSKKVKKVLTTSNILNAMRKKNKELKKKIKESKKEMETDSHNIEEPPVLEEGSIEHYNTLLGSTRFVDPVSGITENTENKLELENSSTENNDNSTKKTVMKDTQITKGMKKDAKQLLKMYKKLLKYNDMNKERQPSKKKKKKQKKSKN